MPIISTFFGIVIRMYYKEHAPRHFHAVYQGQQGTFDFSGQPLAGNVKSGTALRLRRDWATAHRSQLEAMGEHGGRPTDIAPETLYSAQGVEEAAS